MDNFVLIVLLILFFLIIILIPIVFGYGIYVLIKRYFSQKYANYFRIIYIIFLVYAGLNIIFEDELFSKNDAIELVEDLDFKLNDDFKLIENVSDWGILPHI